MATIQQHAGLVSSGIRRGVTGVEENKMQRSLTKTHALELLCDCGSLKNVSAGEKSPIFEQRRQLCSLIACMKVSTEPFMSMQSGWSLDAVQSGSTSIAPP